MFKVIINYVKNIKLFNFYTLSMTGFMIEKEMWSETSLKNKLSQVLKDLSEIPKNNVTWSINNNLSESQLKIREFLIKNKDILKGKETEILTQSLGNYNSSDPRTKGKMNQVNELFTELIAAKINRHNISEDKFNSMGDSVKKDRYKLDDNLNNIILYIRNYGEKFTIPTERINNQEYSINNLKSWSVPTSDTTKIQSSSNTSAILNEVLKAKENSSFEVSKSSQVFKEEKIAAEGILLLNPSNTSSNNVSSQVESSSSNTKV